MASTISKTGAGDTNVLNVCPRPVIFFIERCMYKARINHLTLLAKKSNFMDVSNEYNKDVTHLIAQNSNKTQVLDFLIKKKNISTERMEKCSVEQNFVDVSWFVSCMKEKKVVPVLDDHILKEDNLASDIPFKKSKFDEANKVPVYACQRSSPLDHKNKIFTDALEILEEHRIYRGDPHAESRALAFRRGSSTLKCLPFQIYHESQLKNLPHIDMSGSTKPGHCKRVIAEILSQGYATEAEEVSGSEFFRTMKLFCGIYGVGPQTARKWFYDLKLRTLDDIRNCPSVILNRDQTFGLDYYSDLNSPVPIQEAKEVESLILEVALSIKEGTEITLVGGFRRGKPVGHDIDLLITHPVEGKEKLVLREILTKLKDRFIYIHKKDATTENPFHGKSTMDHFETCYGIFKVYKEENDSNSDRNWIARRVDLIAVPYSEFPFALLGWTGSRHFEREIRRYAKAEKRIVLTSHGMFTLEGKHRVPASSEEEIFERLGLAYQEPSDRNC